MIGGLERCEGGRSVQNSRAEPAISVAPRSVKPYAHHMRVHGQVRGSRHFLANESWSSFRKSSVIGFGAAAPHNSHRNQAASTNISAPASTENSAYNAPVRTTTLLAASPEPARRQGCTNP